MTTNRMGYLPRYLQFMESWKLVGSLTHSPSCPKLCTSALIYAGPNSPASRRKLQCLTSGQAQLEKAASGEAGPLCPRSNAGSLQTQLAEGLPHQHHHRALTLLLCAHGGSHCFSSGTTLPQRRTGLFFLHTCTKLVLCMNIYLFLLAASIRLTF